MTITNMTTIGTCSFQMQAHHQINNETQDALEREELNEYAHEYDVHYSVIDAFFKAQQEGII